MYLSIWPVHRRWKYGKLKGLFRMQNLTSSPSLALESARWSWFMGRSSSSRVSCSRFRLSTPSSSSSSLHTHSLVTVRCSRPDVVGCFLLALNLLIIQPLHLDLAINNKFLINIVSLGVSGTQSESAKRGWLVITHTGKSS